MVAKRKPPKNAKRFASGDPTDVAQWLMKPEPCSKCGHCPTCGRSNVAPYWPYGPYQPYYPWPWIVTSGTIQTSSGTTTIYPNMTVIPSLIS